MVKVWLHSTGDASPLHPNAAAALGAPALAALLLRQIRPVFSVVAPWERGASSVSVRRQTFTTGNDTIQRRDRDRPHPATFPPRLPEQCLHLRGLSGIAVAMDPFTGLGSTAIACARLGIDFIGADIDETYLTEAVARTRAAVAISSWPTPGPAAA